MLSELTRLKDEATRLLTIYEEYKNCNDEYMRRKAHVDLDRFLMQHREIAAVLMVQGLQDAFDQIVTEYKTEEAASVPWYKRLIGVKRYGNRKNQKYKLPVHSEQQGL